MFKYTSHIENCQYDFVNILKKLHGHLFFRPFAHQVNRHIFNAVGLVSGCDKTGNITGFNAGTVIDK